MDRPPVKGWPRARYCTTPPASQFTGKLLTLFWPKWDPPHTDGLPTKGWPQTDRVHAQATVQKPLASLKLCGLHRQTRCPLKMDRHLWQMYMPPPLQFTGKPCASCHAKLMRCPLKTD